MEKLRDKLKSFVTYEEGESIREKLNEHSRKNYEPEHEPGEYLKFMNNHACTFRVNHPQVSNFPYYWTMFSIPSQHVRGDCVEECLDNAISILEKGTFKHLL